MELVRKANSSFRGKCEPRPSRTLLLFEAVTTAMEERLRIAVKKPSPPLIAPSFGNDENAHTSWLSCLRAQFESVAQLRQRYNWVFSQRQNASAREAQLLFGNSDATELLGPTGDQRRTMAATLQAIRDDMKRLDVEMYSMEVRLESEVLGCLECGIHGLAGFARLSPRSTFRLVLKHAEQKWESRITTGRHNKQFIDNDTHRFQIVLDYSLGIKAEEERSIGGSPNASTSSASSGSSDSFLRSLMPRALVPHRLIGTVNFDVLPLINALPQLLTISLNSSGSIKLHIIAKWVPPPPPITTTNGNEQTTYGPAMLALEASRGSATFAARRHHGSSPRYGKGSRTVRQPKSMSLNPNDVGALLSQMAVDEPAETDGDPNSMSSTSPIPSLSGSASMSYSSDRHSSWSWVRNAMNSPKSEMADSSEGGYTSSRSLNPAPGSGMDRIRALALHDLNSSAESSIYNRKDSKLLPIIGEPGASVVVPKESIVSRDKFRPDEAVSGQDVVKAITSLLEELRNRHAEVDDFQQAFSAIRTMLLLPSSAPMNLPTLAKSKSVNAATLAVRATPVRQSIRRRKNHQDLLVNVEPTVPSENDRDKTATQSPLPPSDLAGLATTHWPELDAAINSHLQRSADDLHRLSTVAFLPDEVGCFVRQQVLDSLSLHTVALSQVFIPLVSAPPSKRASLAADLTATLLPSVESNSLWYALCQSPSGLIALPTATLHAELTKRISDLRSHGAQTYGSTAAAVSDQVVARMTQYYGDYVAACSGNLPGRTSTVTTLCDFAFFAGDKSAGIISKLEDTCEEVKFCHCLEPAILRRSSGPAHDDAAYASALQATRRMPSPLLILALAGAINSNNQDGISAAIKSASPEWSMATVNCVGSMLLWSAADNRNKPTKETTTAKLALISLLHLISTSIENLKETVSAILVRLASNDNDNAVKAAARNSALLLGQIGLSAVGKLDRSVNNGFHSLRVPQIISTTSDDEEEFIQEF